MASKLQHIWQNNVTGKNTLVVLLRHLHSRHAVSGVPSCPTCTTTNSPQAIAPHPEGELVSRSMQTYGCDRPESRRRMDTFRPRLASQTVGPSYTIRHWVQSPTIGPTTGCPLLGILIGLLDPVYLVVRGKKPNNCSRYWGLCKPCSV